MMLSPFKFSILLLSLGTLAPIAHAAQRYVEVECTAGSSAVIDTKGNLYVTGDPANGILGDGMWKAPKKTTYRPRWLQTAKGVATILLGDKFSMYLSKKGRVYVTGLNELGRLGTGKTKDISTWKAVSSPGNTLIGRAELSTFRSDLDGTLWVSGENERGTLYDGKNYYTPGWTETGEKGMNMTKVLGYPGNVVLGLGKDGVLYAMAYARGSVINVLTPTWTPTISGVRDLDGTSLANSYLLTKDDILLAADLSSNEVGIGGKIDSATPLASGVKKFKLARNTKTKALGYIDLNNDLHLLYEVSGGGYADNIIGSGVADFCVGEHHALAIRTDGTLWGSGTNNAGELGYQPNRGTAAFDDWKKLKTPLPLEVLPAPRPVKHSSTKTSSDASSSAGETTGTDTNTGK